MCTSQLANNAGQHSIKKTLEVSDKEMNMKFQRLNNFSLLIVASEF